MVINPRQLNNQSTQEGDEQLKKLLNDNLKLTEEIHKMTKSIKHFVVWQRVFSILKILIIVVPIVLSFIYLPRLVEDIKNNPDGILQNSWLSGYFESIIDTATEKIDLNQVEIDSDKVPG